MKLPTRRMPAWAPTISVPRDPGEGIAAMVGSASAQKVDPSVREIDIGPVPSITPAERADRKGMKYIVGRGKMDGSP